VFDANGTAVHKIYLEPEGNTATWDGIVATRSKDLPLVVDPLPAPRAEKPDANVDAAGFTAAWDAMQDTHEFFHLLMKFGVTRTQALRVAGPSRAKRVANNSMGKILDGAAASQDKIMIFVGNRGCLQVFSGKVNKIVRMGPWLNVLDPGFNLHLRDDKIATSWVVSKPTKSGVVTSLELFDEAGENIALVFRKRDDREKAEDPSWSALLSTLEAV
jgi:putative hemin transport protein